MARVKRELSQSLDPAWLEGKAHIGFVRAKAIHRLGVDEVGEGIGQFDLIQTRKQGAGKAFGDAHDVIFTHEGHLDVDLGKFGLPIGAQILFI